MNFKNKYFNCSGKVFFSNEEPYNRYDANLYHVVAEDEYGVKYLLKFETALNDKEEITYCKTPVSANPLSKLDISIIEGAESHLVLSNGSILTEEMRKKGFWVRENKKYIPIYSYDNYGDDAIIVGFIVRPLKLRDFVESVEEKGLNTRRESL